MLKRVNIHNYGGDAGHIEMGGTFLGNPIQRKAVHEKGGSSYRRKKIGSSNTLDGRNGKRLNLAERLAETNSESRSLFQS